MYIFSDINFSFSFWLQRVQNFHCMIGKQRAFL